MSELLLREQLDLLFRFQHDPPFLKSPSPTGATIPADAIQQLPGGGMTLKIEGRYLHSRHDPDKEALRQYKSLQLPVSGRLLLFFGSGLGHVLRMAIAETNNPCVLFEPDNRILSALLSFHDFRPWIRSGRLKFIPAIPDEETLHVLFKGYRNQDVLFIPHRPSLSLRPDYLESIRRCERFLNKKDVNLATLSRFDRQWSANFIRNLPALSLARPVSVLFGGYNGSTAVICGAGPSLTDSLPEIKKYRDQILLIAVDTSLRILTSSGIDPDFIVTVDPQPLNRHYLEGYSGNAFIVADPTTDPHSLRALNPERLFFTWSPFRLSSLFFHRWSVPPGEIAFGGSVSTNAYDLAYRLGSHKIILTGQDLSFPGKIAHAKGAVLEERWNYRESRIERREIHNLRQMNSLPVRNLDAIDGGTVPTNDKLIIFHSWFQNRLRLDLQNGMDVSNATVRGAFIPGVPHASLEELLQKGSPESSGQIPKRGSNLDHDFLRLRTSPYFDRDGFLDDLESLIQSLRRLLPHLEEGVRVCRECIDRFRNFSHETKGEVLPDYMRWKDKLDTIDAEIRQHLEISEILGNALQSVILRITESFAEANLPDIAEIEKPEDRQALYLQVFERSLALYSGLLHAAREHIAHIGKTKAIMGLMNAESI